MYGGVDHPKPRCTLGTAQGPAGGAPSAGSHRIYLFFLPENTSHKTQP